MLLSSELLIGARPGLSISLPSSSKMGGRLDDATNLLSAVLTFLGELMNTAKAPAVVNRRPKP